jgi:hypothetical protein
MLPKYLFKAILVAVSSEKGTANITPIIEDTMAI